MDEVVLLAGKINSTTIVNYWKIDYSYVRDEDSLEIGDYAIVENKHGYDLVEVVGYLSVDKNNSSLFSNTKYENMKKVIKFIRKEELKNE